MEALQRRAARIVRPNKIICVVPVTYSEKIRVGRSELIFYFIFKFYFLKIEFFHEYIK